ncbi:MAG: hypothetical protein IVW54_15985 [Candidatus Binataceae bacterium]|nr:hypothetical protein [Candidatus Binataceae bacterium]
MISAKPLFEELILSLRNVIAPAIPDPYPRTQAYMAAVILEFLARQVEERSDIAAGRSRALASLFADLAKIPGVSIGDRAGGQHDDEARLAKLIEDLYAQRETIGEAAFVAAHGRVRRALRELLDLDLMIAGKSET